MTTHQITHPCGHRLRYLGRTTIAITRAHRIRRGCPRCRALGLPQTTVRKATDAPRYGTRDQGRPVRRAMAYLTRAGCDALAMAMESRGLGRACDLASTWLASAVAWFRRRGTMAGWYYIATGRRGYALSAHVGYCWRDAAYDCWRAATYYGGHLWVRTRRLMDSIPGFCHTATSTLEPFPIIGK